MNFTVSVQHRLDLFFPTSQCLSCYCCCALRGGPATFFTSTTSRPRFFPRNSSSFSAIISRPGKRSIACQAVTETEPDSNDAEEELQPQKESLPASVSDLIQNENTVYSIGNEEELQPQKDSPPASVSDLMQNENTVDFIGNEEKDGLANDGSVGQEATLSKNEENLVSENSNQDGDGQEVASGSPLPGMKQRLDESIRIPKATIDIFKDQLFGFDTFFVTSQEPYEGGVLFKGNLRGKAATSYEKITKRMKEKFGDQYKLFLLINPEDDKPVAVVIPKRTLQPESTAVPEWFAASAFGIVTIFTLLLRNVPALQSNLLSTFDNLALLKDGLPGALVTVLILGFHEFGHIFVAKDIGVKFGVPYFVPSWQIGSFGAITRIVSIVANREDLLKLSAAGPLAGFSLGLVLLLLGFILPPSDGIGIVIDPVVFHQSFLAGGIAKLLLGEALKEGTPLSINPLVLWAWAGLLINAINSIPAGELDGGRISFALWGRKVSARLSGAALALLGISSLFSDVAFYWAVLIFFLQRGPVAPLSDEITEPDTKNIALGIAVLVLGMLIYLPYPFPFTSDLINIDL